LPNELKIAIKDKIEVHYANSLTSLLFYRDVSSDVSWLEVKGGYVRVNKDGTLLNPTEVIISGDMSLATSGEHAPHRLLAYQTHSIKRTNHFGSNSFRKGLCSDRQAILLRRGNYLVERFYELSLKYAGRYVEQGALLSI